MMRQIKILGVVLTIGLVSVLGIKVLWGQNSLTVEEKIAQLLVVGIYGSEPEEVIGLERALGEFKLGGVVLFSRNLQDAEQLMRLTRFIHQKSAFTPIVAIDQEGGIISRIKEVESDIDFLSAREMSKAREGNDEAVYFQGRMSGKILAGYGINYNFAPVVDISFEGNFINNKGRTFSADPIVVTESALGFIKGAHDEGIKTCLKHFPGHGSSTADSHFGWADVTQTWVKRAELFPYQWLLARHEKGTVQIDSIMVGHTFNRNLDELHTASLSANTIDRWLKTKDGFNYNGVVITDDLSMQAITDNYARNEILVMALNAGVDLLLWCHEWEEGIDMSEPSSVVELDKQLESMIATIMEAVKRGDLATETIERAYQRVKAFKEGLRS